MSRVDELIQDLCPSGVEYEAIAELITRSEKVHWDDLDQTDEFRYIDLSTVDRVTHSINGTETITKENAPSRAQQVVREGDVLFGTTRPMLKRYCIVPADYDGQVASTGFCVLRANTDRILTNFLFHLLGTATFYEYVQTNERGASYPAIPDNVVKKFRIPVPPLEVQREIVRILDKFTQLEAELEAELEARRSQYEHYLSHLFEGLPEGTPLKTFSDVGVFSRGGGPQKKDFIDSGVGCIHYGQIYTHYGVSATVTNKFVSAAAAARAKGAYPGDVVIAVTSENDDDLARSVAWLGSDWVAVSNHTLIFTSEMDPRFVSYYLRSRQFDSAKRKYISGTKVKSLPLRAFENIQIPVPPMVEQVRLADLLDTFDALVNDISVGLPAELAARRKQYEHYRDRLLTFKELAS